MYKCPLICDCWYNNCAIGVCVFFFKYTASRSETGNKLKLICGFDSTTSTKTTQSLEKTAPITHTQNPSQFTTSTARTTTLPTTMSITTSKLPVTTTVQTATTTTTTGTNELDIANVTITDVAVTKNKAHQLRIRGTLSYDCEHYLSHKL